MNITTKAASGGFPDDSYFNDDRHLEESLGMITRSRSSHNDTLTKSSTKSSGKTSKSKKNANISFDRTLNNSTKSITKSTSPDKSTSIDFALIKDSVFNSTETNTQDNSLSNIKCVSENSTILKNTNNETANNSSVDIDNNKDIDVSLIENKQSELSTETQCSKPRSIIETSVINTEDSSNRNTSKMLTENKDDSLGYTRFLNASVISSGTRDTDVKSKFLNVTNLDELSICTNNVTDGNNIKDEINFSMFMNEANMDNKNARLSDQFISVNATVIDNQENNVKTTESSFTEDKNSISLEASLNKDHIKISSEKNLNDEVIKSNNFEESLNIDHIKNNSTLFSEQSYIPEISNITNIDSKSKYENVTKYNDSIICTNSSINKCAKNNTNNTLDFSNLIGDISPKKKARLSDVFNNENEQILIVKDLNENKNLDIENSLAEDNISTSLEISLEKHLNTIHVEQSLIEENIKTTSDENINSVSFEESLNKDLTTNNSLFLERNNLPDTTDKDAESKFENITKYNQSSIFTNSLITKNDQNNINNVADFSNFINDISIENDIQYKKSRLSDKLIIENDAISIVMDTNEDTNIEINNISAAKDINSIGLEVSLIQDLNQMASLNTDEIKSISNLNLKSFDESINKDLKVNKSLENNSLNETSDKAFVESNDNSRNLTNLSICNDSLINKSIQKNMNNVTDVSNFIEDNVDQYPNKTFEKIISENDNNTIDKDINESNNLNETGKSLTKEITSTSIEVRFDQINTEKSLNISKTTVEEKSIENISLIMAEKSLRKDELQNNLQLLDGTSVNIKSISENITKFDDFTFSNSVMEEYKQSHLRNITNHMLLNKEDDIDIIKYKPDVFNKKSCSGNENIYSNSDPISNLTLHDDSNFSKLFENCLNKDLDKVPFETNLNKDSNKTVSQNGEDIARSIHENKSDVIEDSILNKNENKDTNIKEKAHDNKNESTSENNSSNLNIREDEIKSPENVEVVLDIINESDIIGENSTQVNDGSNNECSIENNVSNESIKEDKNVSSEDLREVLQDSEILDAADMMQEECSRLKDDSLPNDTTTNSLYYYHHYFNY